jgi:hypothetical protein
MFLRYGNAYRIVFTLEIYDAFQWPLLFPATISTERNNIHLKFNKAMVHHGRCQELELYMYIEGR